MAMTNRISGWKTLQNTATAVLGLASFALAAPPVPDPLKAKPEVVEAWKDMRFGMFIHWGPVVLTEKEISWSRGLAEGEQEKPMAEWLKKVRSEETTTPAGEYDKLHTKWNPAKFDAEEWVKIAKDAGQKYLIFTTKHHDGFCLFDSKLTDHKTTAPDSSWKVDAVGELADACHKHGLKFILYYSQPDWHHPDYLTEHHDRYVTYLHGQIRELLTHYGPIDGLWFDNLRPVNKATAELWDAEKLFRMARSIQPDLIINNRCGLEADFETPEQHVGHFSRKRPWESCITLGTQWVWKSGDKLKSHQEAVKMLVVCAVGDGNLALNTNPMPDGRIEPRQVESFRKIGDWTRKYGESIYGTRGGPFVAPDATKRSFNSNRDEFSLPGGNWWGGSTHKEDTVYLHILRWPTETLTLPNIDARIVSSSLLAGGNVSVVQSKDHIKVTVAEEQRDPISTIIKITFDRPVTDIEPVPTQDS